MKIILVILFSINSVICKCDTLDIKKDKHLHDTITVGMQIINKILDLSRLFDGYLVFEVYDLQSVNDGSNYYCTIYYVDLLNDYKMDDAILANTSAEFSLAVGFKGINDSIESNFRLVWRCFNAFNSNKTKGCEPFSFRYWNDFNTNLFEKATLVERDGKKYFIFNFKLYGILYEYYPGRWGRTNRKKYGNLIRTFIPTSELIEFSPVDFKILEDYGFMKSNIVVKFY